MPHFKGMEYLKEAVHMEDVMARLEELSLENWELVTILSGHANLYETGDVGIVFIFMKRPKRRNNP